jgi:HSP20 family protein
MFSVFSKQNNQLTNIFNDFFQDHYKVFNWFSPESEKCFVNSSFYPQVDIEENDMNFILKLDVPGINKQDVNIYIENNILTIEYKIQNQQNKKLLYTERLKNEFKRNFSLADNIDIEKLEAKMENGVLEIILPKTIKKPKAIEIKIA